MKSAIKYLLTMVEERDGYISSSRVMFVTGSLYSMGMGAWVFAITHEWVALITVVPTLFSPFALQKTYQKSQEKTSE